MGPSSAGIVCGFANTIATLPGAYGNSLTGCTPQCLASALLQPPSQRDVCAGVLASFQSWPAVFAVAILHWAVGGAIYWRWASAEKVI